MSGERVSQASGLSAETVAGALTLAINVIENRILPRDAHVPGNLLAASLAMVHARQQGVTWEEQGLDHDALRRGARLGLAAAIPLAVVSAAGLAFLETRRFYHDARIEDTTLKQVLYEVFVRVPLGTALPEELVFRGALLGLFRRRRSQRQAAVASSALFGLWHILPTLDRIGRNPGTRRVAGLAVPPAAVVAAVVGATGAVGYGLCWLRFKSGSLLAPVIAHVAPNAVAIFGGWLAYHYSQRSARA
jgi:hypothetical protein